jgi:threonine dehydratase
VIPLDRIRAAAERARAHVRRTPLLPQAGAWLKLECLQPTGSFKVRGFFAAALELPDEQLRRGLITVSAGNAALGCAYVARELGVSCRVVMFETAPPPKVEGVRRLGAEAVLKSREDLFAWMAARGWEQEPETFLHPFASESVMAGHGGIGLEIVDDLPDLARLVVPVGGGGLITGVASAVKALRPEVAVVGVQSEGYPLWPRALEAGGPVAITPQTIADGTTAPFDDGQLERLREVVDRWVVVPEERLRSAVRDVPLQAKVVAEGAGALGFAALQQLEPGPVTAVVVSGGNIDPSLLADLLDRPFPS